MNTSTLKKIPGSSLYLFQFWIRIPMEFLPAVGLWKTLPIRKPCYWGMLPVFLKKYLHSCKIWSAAAQYGINSCLVVEERTSTPWSLCWMAPQLMFAVSRQAGCTLDFHLLSFFSTQDLKILYRVVKWEIKETMAAYSLCMPAHLHEKKCSQSSSESTYF